jgi:hypothetical protein
MLRRHVSLAGQYIALPSSTGRLRSKPSESLIFCAIECTPGEVRRKSRGKGLRYRVMIKDVSRRSATRMKGSEILATLLTTTMT